MNRSARPARELHALWESYLAAADRPGIDRWLSARLGALNGMSRADRLWIGAQMLEACRLGLRVLFQERFPAGRGPDEAGAIRRFQERYPRSADLRAALRAIPAAEFFLCLRAGAPPPARHSRRGAASLEALLIGSGLPPALLPLLERRARLSGWSPEEKRRFIERHASPPPLWLRLNAGADPGQVRAELERQGLHPQPGPPAALRVSGTCSVYLLACWREGRVEIQDLASQRIGLAAAVRPGQFIWDCCAGAGGKTLQIASLLNGKGAVYASDVNERKLQVLRLRARRGGLSGTVRTLTWNGQALPSFPREVGRHGGFDCVLVDAPCSGSGTWRRNPDGRLFFEPGRLAELAARQQGLLAAASAAVRPGGRLVYATCSFFDEENEEVCRRFLETVPGFIPQSMEILGSPREDADTTFAAVFVRGNPVG